ncbi:MAG TPA: hypothetical protein DHV27_07435 [Psychrobacter sp.]|nr:hypothetical protein [Psychrobacter sp.]
MLFDAKLKCTYSSFFESAPDHYNGDFFIHLIRNHSYSTAITLTGLVILMIDIVNIMMMTHCQFLIVLW